MIVGVPKEIKADENRVGMAPSGVGAFVGHGHTVLIESRAGLGSGIPDAAYRQAGARIVKKAESLWDRAELIVKVKEPLGRELRWMWDGQIVYTYLHLASNEKLTRVLMRRGVTAIGYETIQLDDGSLPLLTPMSEVAGRMAVQEGARYLEAESGGLGLLLGGVPGVMPAHVLILGGGVVGTNAAKMAAGMGAKVTILDLSLNRLRYLADVMPANVTLLHSNRHILLEQLAEADLVVGAVLLPGARAPKLVRREDLALMKQGSVIIDVSVDQGGCVETAKPTTHENPTYVVDGVIHYAVANMPGGVPRTSTLALTNATFPYARSLAGDGWRGACRANRPLLLGLNVVEGKVVYPGVADAFGMKLHDPETLI